MAWHLRCCPIELVCSTSDKLTGLHLGIRYDYMDRLAYLLGHFEPSTTHLFETAGYHVFDDGATRLGFGEPFPQSYAHSRPHSRETAAVELSCPAALC